MKMIYFLAILSIEIDIKETKLFTLVTLLRKIQNFVSLGC